VARALLSALLTVLVGLVAGFAAGVLAGLLRRRPVPDAISYVAPTPAQGPTAVGPHRAVLRA
jgi:hypothetical protein